MLQLHNGRIGNAAMQKLHMNDVHFFVERPMDAQKDGYGLCCRKVTATQNGM
ncbi:hypothetical protein [Antarctobacter heliothermus]|uniref:hypothetical protein n=1 Tax=Antarctobacter heliothermus TaxID=74033 RepID=UPI0012FD4077|nr:hypothetical protein [Antarctobacter heliothermus]